MQQSKKNLFNALIIELGSFPLRWWKDEIFFYSIINDMDNLFLCIVKKAVFW